LFIAVSGSHAYGWARDDADLDIRLVWIPSLKQALSVKYRGHTVESKNGPIDLTTTPLYHFLRLLVKGNGNSLENLFQEKLSARSVLVKELQELALENVHVGFLKHYRGYYESLKKDMANPTRCKKYGIQKLILSAYRVLKAGIILGNYKMVCYNLQEQDKHHPSTHYRDILYDYKNQTPSTNYSMVAAKNELEKLDSLLKTIIDNCGWFKMFPSVVFDNWIYQYYKKVLGD